MAEKDKYSRGLKSRHVQLIALGGTIEPDFFLIRQVDSLGRSFDCFGISDYGSDLLFVDACDGRIASFGSKYALVY